MTTLPVITANSTITFSTVKCARCGSRKTAEEMIQDYIWRNGYQEKHWYCDDVCHDRHQMAMEG
jgi:hypothetical protein